MSNGLQFAMKTIDNMTIIIMVVTLKAKQLYAISSEQFYN